MNVLDLSNFGYNLETELKGKLEDFLYDLVTSGFDDNPYLHKRFALECALKQHPMADGLYNGLADKFGINAEYLSNAYNQPFPESQQDLMDQREADEYSSLHTPILLKAHRTLFELIDNIAFPLDDDSTGIKRTNSRFCNENNLQDFLPALNACFQNILQTEDQQFGFISEYQSILSEGLAHSFWGIDHEYDDKIKTVRPINPNTQQIAVYPQRSSWKRANRLRYLDIEYDLILGRPDFDQEILEQLKPSGHVRDENANNDIRQLHTNGHSIVNDHDVPFNKIRVYKICCPSLTLEYDGEIYHASNVVVYGLIRPDFIDDNAIEDRPFYILGIEQNVADLDTGFYLENVIPSNGDEFYNEGLLYPYLEHQRAANAFLSSAIRTTTYFSQSPIVKEQSMLGAIENEEEEDEVGIYPFKVMKGKCYPYFDASVMNSVQPAFNALKMLEQEVFEGIGITKSTQGIANGGRTTATEMLRVSANGDVKPMRIAARFIKGILIPSRFVRLTEKVRILKEQVMAEMGAAKEAISETNPENQLPDDQILELILDNNEAFKQCLDFSGLDIEYERFFRKRQRELLDNERILQEQQSLAEEVLKLTHLAESPIMPFNPAQHVPPKTIMNEQGVPVGTVPPTAEDIKMYQEQYMMAEQQKRQEAAKRASELELQVKQMTLAVEPIMEVPPPSNAMYFKMLTEDVKQGDLKFSGALAVFNKMSENGALDRLLNLFSVLPPEAIDKVDFEKVLALVTRGENIKPSEIMKDIDKLEREEQMRKAQEQVQRQKTDILLQNPGAQDPNPPQ